MKARYFRIKAASTSFICQIWVWWTWAPGQQLRKLRAHIRQHLSADYFVQTSQVRKSVLARLLALRLISIQSPCRLRLAVHDGGSARRYSSVRRRRHRSFARMFGLGLGT